MLIRGYKNYDPTIITLVSYPRTGSHWLRMVLEKYLQKFCLPRSFYNTKEYWGNHIHDRIVGEGVEGRTKGFEKVIYLYRNPIDVVYSQLKYENMKFEDRHKIMDEYYIHLDRWLNNSSDIDNILYVKYESLKDKPIDIFRSIIEFLGYEWNEKKLKDIYDESTLENLNKNIQDTKVINNSHFNGSYNFERKEFRKTFGKEIENKFLGIFK